VISEQLVVGDAGQIGRNLVIHEFNNRLFGDMLVPYTNSNRLLPVPVFTRYSLYPVR